MSEFFMSGPEEGDQIDERVFICNSDGDEVLEIPDTGDVETNKEIGRHYADLLNKGVTSDRRIQDLLEGNNRYLQEGRDARRELRKIREENIALKDEIAQLLVDFGATKRQLKTVTACKWGFTYEPTGERVTLYAPDARSMELLQTEPGLMEAIRDIFGQIDRGESIQGAPKSEREPRSIREAVSNLEADEQEAS